MPINTIYVVIKTDYSWPEDPSNIEAVYDNKGEASKHAEAIQLYSDCEAHVESCEINKCFDINRYGYGN